MKSENQNDAAVAMKATADGCDRQYNDGSGTRFEIRARELRQALLDAEHRVHEIMSKIRDQEQKRDDAVRFVGVLQQNLDSLRGECANRTAHVRALEALLP